MKIGVIGASGYAGGELLRLLDAHPQFEVCAVTAHSNAGELITSVHPHLTSYVDRTFSAFKAADFDCCELIFLALPHGESASVIAALHSDAKIVDLGADYRLEDSASGLKYYGDRSEETVNDFLKKRHYHYDYSFLAIDSLYDLHKEPKYNNIIIPENIPLDSMNWSLIQVRIFNPDGSFYNSLAQCSGDFGDEKYTFDFPIIKNECSFKNEKLELKNEFDLMHIDSKTSSQILNEAKKYKYILFVYWNIQSNYF
jgi:hypothetical protein